MSGTVELWVVILGLGIGSFAIRFLFLGMVGDRPLPDWLLRHLRYTAVSIIPALVTPLVVWPSATGGVPDAPRMAAATVAIVVSYLTRNIIAAMVCGGATLYGLLALL